MILSVLSIPALAAAMYLALLTLMSRRPDGSPRPAERLRFDIVVPAHDEEAGIERTIESLLAIDWPSDLFRVLVVADNCLDRTADLAAGAGAVVIARKDTTLRGKGYALKLAFERSIADGFADAVVVVDADTLVSANLLAAFAARLEAGDHVVQARYGVLNPLVSWRTRLMALAFALVNDLRSLGHDRLGVSCGLRGNGMCFSARALGIVPYRAFSLVEDLEYGIQLAEAGIRVRFAREAVVWGEMVASEEASRSQRRRWEGGRLAVARTRAIPLILRGITTRSRVLLHLGLDLLVPPLSWLSLWVILGLAAVTTLVLVGGCPRVVMLPWFVASAFVGVYVARGIQLSGLGLSGLSALAWAPVFVLWKLVLLLRGGGKPAEWIRTARAEKPPGDVQVGAARRRS